MARRVDLLAAILLALAATLFFTDVALSVIPLLHAVAAFLLAAALLPRSLPLKIAGLAALVWGAAMVMRALNLPSGVVTSELVISAILLLVAFSILQDRELPRESRLARVLDGAILTLVVGGLTWFLVVEGHEHSQGHHFLGGPTLALQTLVILPLVSILLYSMYSHQSAISWCVLGSLGISIYSLAWLDGEFSVHDVNVVWELVSMAGLVAFAIGMSREKVRREPSELLPLLPYGLGIIVIAMGMIHIAIGPLEYVDLAVISILGITLILRQSYSFVQQRRLVSLLSEHETQLRHQALHDALTSLPNRALFQDRLEHAVSTRMRLGGELSLIYIDINEFKQINDRYGRLFSDELLIHVARRLSTWVRPSDTVARLGGDEFVVLMESSKEGAIRVAERLSAELARPYELEGRTVMTSVSMGVSSITQWQGESDEIAERLVNLADRAMYQAKGTTDGIVVL